MKKYHSKAGSPARVDYGTELSAGLLRFPETAPLAPEIEKLDDQLFSQYLTRLANRKALVSSRVSLRFANYDADQTLRSLGRACEDADGRKGGPLFKAIFKEGLAAAVRPDGKQQIPATAKIAKNLAECALHGADALRAAWTGKLEDAISALEAAAGEQDAAQKEHDTAFSAEMALRNQHWLAVDKVQGQVRAAFPGNAVKQDLVFPELDVEPDEPVKEKEKVGAGEAKSGGQEGKNG